MIVNLASLTAKQPIDGIALSNALRPALVGMAKTLSREAAPEVRVNNVATEHIPLTGSGTSRSALAPGRRVSGRHPLADGVNLAAGPVCELARGLEPQTFRSIRPREQSPAVRRRLFGRGSARLVPNRQALCRRVAVNVAVSPCS